MTDKKKKPKWGFNLGVYKIHIAKVAENKADLFINGKKTGQYSSFHRAFLKALKITKKGKFK